MNVLFLTDNKADEGLRKEFVRGGNRVYTLCLGPIRIGTGVAGNFRVQLRKQDVSSSEAYAAAINSIRVWSDDARTNIAEALLSGKERLFTEVKIDLIIARTPIDPYFSVAGFYRRRDYARIYLLADHIYERAHEEKSAEQGFRLNGLFRSTVNYYYNRGREMDVYKMADFIRVQSKEDAAYLLSHNSFLKEEKLDVCRNGFTITDKSVSPEKRAALKSRADIPTDRTAILFAGDFADDTDRNFVLSCMEAERYNESVFFALAGVSKSFTWNAHTKIIEYMNAHPFDNACAYRKLPGILGNDFVQTCEVCVVFDREEPMSADAAIAKLKGFLMAKAVIIAITPEGSPMSRIVKAGGFGVACEPGSTEAFSCCVRRVCSADLSEVGQNGLSYLLRNCDIRNNYLTIIRHFL